MDPFRGERDAMEARIVSAERRARDAEASLDRITRREPDIAALHADGLLTVARPGPPAHPAP